MDFTGDNNLHPIGQSNPLDLSGKSLSNDEYNLILNFLFDYEKGSHGQEPLLRLLMCLTKYFSCSCASLWTVDSDMNMKNPISWDLDPRLIEDYLNKFNSVDEYHVRYLHQGGEQVASVYEYNDDMRKPSEYLESLRAAGISHRYAILLRDHGELKGTIALFKSIDDTSRISTQCLEVLAPFITQEFLKAHEQDDKRLSAAIMRNILNTSKTGIALFENSNGHEIYYYNAACVNYCSRFRKEENDIGAIKSFLNYMVRNLGELWPMMKDSRAVFSTEENGKTIKFNVRMVENSEGSDGLSSLFITPINDEQSPDLLYTDFYSQLTKREQEITMLMAKGFTNQEISEKLFISISTVKTHIQHIFEKANVSNRTSLLAMMNGNTEEL